MSASSPGKPLEYLSTASDSGRSRASRGKIATPRPVIAKLNAEVARILQLPELKKRMDEDGMVVVASSPDEFRDFFARESQKFSRVIETAGIKGTL